MKFSIKDFFSKCGQIRSFLWIWSHLLKKSLIENFIFFAVNILAFPNHFIKMSHLQQSQSILDSSWGRNSCRDYQELEQGSFYLFD